MGTEELADIVSDFIGMRNAVLMENHGMLAVGESIDIAYSNAVIVEEAAKITLLAMQIGNMKTITNQECDYLRKLTIENYGQK